MECDRGDSFPFDFPFDLPQFRNSADRELTTGAKIDFQLRSNKAFRHVKTLFVQGNQVRTDQKRRFVLISTNLITLDE